MVPVFEHPAANVCCNKQSRLSDPFPDGVHVDGDTKAAGEPGRVAAGTIGAAGGAGQFAALVIKLALGHWTCGPPTGVGYARAFVLGSIGTAFPEAEHHPHRPLYTEASMAEQVVIGWHIDV